MLCLCLLTASKGAEHTDTPAQQGPMAVWDFTSDQRYDQIGHKRIKYGPPIHYGSSRDHRFDTIAGRVGIKTLCTLPYKLSEMSDTISIVMTYIYRDDDDIDGDVLTLGFFGTLLSGDDGTLKLRGGTDTTYQTKLSYELPTRRDKAGNVTVIYSIYALPQTNDGRADFLQSLSAGGIQYQSYRYATHNSRFSPNWNWHTKKMDYDSIYVHTPAPLTRIALYNRLLTPEEQAAMMGTEDVETYLPGDDISHIDWRWPFPVAMIILVIAQAVRQRKKRYKAVKADDITATDTQQLGAREAAMAHVEAAWNAFGSKAEPRYPETEAQMAEATAALDAAMATGCADAYMVDEYNRLAAIANHCRQFAYINRFATFMAVLLLVMAAFEPFTDHLLIYTIGTRAFYIYYLSAFAVIVCGNAERYRGNRGCPIPKAEKLMSLMVKAGQAAVMTGAAVGSAVVGIIATIGGLILLMLNIMLSFITEFVIVVVSTGKVVAQGITGFTSGLIVGGLVAIVIGKLLFFVFIAILWCLVIAMPVISYYTTRKCL